MAFPKKFQSRLELTLSDVEHPDYILLTYAICGCTKDACGWEGWIIESAFKHCNPGNPLDGSKTSLPCQSEQICEACGKTLFRTEASLRYDLSKDQHSEIGLPVPGIDYDLVPMEYEEE